MPYSPENLERPNKSEQAPKRGVAERTIKALGKAAIKGTKR